MNKRKVGKVIACTFVLLVIALLQCNSNNNPHSYICLLCHPNYGGESAFFWENIILLVFMFIMFDRLYSITKWAPLQHFFGKVIAVMIYTLIFTQVGDDVTKLYKHFQTGLEAIYLQRDDMRIEVNNKQIVDGYFKLENCSNKEQCFQVEITYWDNDSEGEWKLYTYVLEEEFFMGPRTTERIELNDFKEEKIVNTSASISTLLHFKIRLFNEDESVIFEDEYANLGNEFK